MHHFAYRDGVLHAEQVDLIALAEAAGTPFYCYSSATLERHYKVFAGAFVIVWSAAVTFVLLKVVGIFVPLRMSQENMEIGDVAEHGHEVYPSDIPSLGFPNGIPGFSGTPEPAGA